MTTAIFEVPRMGHLNWGFCDLSISKNYDLTKLHILENLGYNTIAINTFIPEPDEEPKKKKKKGEIKEKKDYIPLPVEIPQDVRDSTKLNILQRVTVEFSDSSIAHKMNQSENLKKYDLIAAMPRTLQAFQYVCGAMDVDIITFEHEIRIPFKVSRKLYRQAIDRGLFFELMYSPAIVDRTSRKNIITTAHIYHAIGKCRNIILTSSAENQSQLRDVHDVINVGFILGLDSKQSLQVVRSNARRLLLKARGRRCGKHYMTIRTANKTQAITVQKI